MLTLCLALLGTDAHAWQVRNNDHGQELSWKNRSISYHVDPSNTEGLSEAAVTSMIAAGTRSWTTPVGDGLAFVDNGRATGALDPHDGKNIIFFEDTWAHDPTLVGLTYVWSRPDGEIIGFDMALNTQDHTWSVDVSDDAGGSSACDNFLLTRLLATLLILAIARGRWEGQDESGQGGLWYRSTK